MTEKEMYIELINGAKFEAAAEDGSIYSAVFLEDAYDSDDSFLCTRFFGSSARSVSFARTLKHLPPNDWHVNERAQFSYCIRSKDQILHNLLWSHHNGRDEYIIDDTGRIRHTEFAVHPIFVPSMWALCNQDATPLENGNWAVEGTEYEFKGDWVVSYDCKWIKE